MSAKADFSIQLISKLSYLHENIKQMRLYSWRSWGAFVYCSRSSEKVFYDASGHVSTCMKQTLGIAAYDWANAYTYIYVLFSLQLWVNSRADWDLTALVKQPVKEKENSKLKPVKTPLKKIDLMSHPARAEGLINTYIYVLEVIG